MAQTPKFIRSDGSLTENLTLVTSVRDQVLTGELSSNIIDVQVSINGAGFQSDPTLVSFDQDSFTVPNQQALPEGLRLGFGQNTVEVRVIDVTGTASSPIIANIEVVRPADIGLVVNAPSGLRMRRKRDTVEVVWSENPRDTVIGYHVYASSEPSGGDQGYRRINRELISESEFQEEGLVTEAEDNVFFQSSNGELNILLTEQDFSGNPIQTVGDATVDTSIAGPEIKVTTTVETVETTNFYVFEHDRDGGINEGFINNDLFTDVPDTELLYYVVTAVLQDPNSNEQIESAFSGELPGLPLPISTQIQEPPRRDRFDVSQDYLEAVRSFDEEISLIPGSVTRDIFIDPFSQEAERMYIVADFIRRSQSFATLLIADESPDYKEALRIGLGLGSGTNIQVLVDDAFDKLAANYQVTRQGSEPAVGQAVFFTTNEPVQDITIEEGTLLATENTSNSVSFRVTSRKTLPVDQKESFYNPTLQRWEITASIRATEPGEDGNVATGKITRIIGGPASVRVTNTEATRFGQDEESNEELAERAILAFSGVDSGTEAGYRSTALRQPGVFRTNIVKANDPYMMRDYDPIRMKHIGGKVDIWIQGSREQTVSDTFALSFRTKQDVQFFLISTPSNLIFEADDPNLSPQNPISELLGKTPTEIASGFGFRNSTTGQLFDLTNAQIIDYNKVQLDSSISQPALNVNDVVTGDYKFLESSRYEFSRQPAFQVDSVVSIDTDDVLERRSNFNLIRTEDPLLEGYSTRAQDFIEITEANGIPTGDTFIVNNERHVLVGEMEEPLDRLGIDEFTVKVFSIDRSIQYDSPSSGSPDYFIESGNATTPLRIVRNPAGDINNGQEVSVDYEHDENFEVQYVINSLLDDVQNAIDDQRHVTADVLVKQAIMNELILEMTVVLRDGSVQSQVDSLIRTSLSQLLNSKGIGEPVHQSDIVQAVENIGGVSHVIMPLTKFTQEADNTIVREPLNSTFETIEQLASSSILGFQERLNYATTLSGGSDQFHRDVFRNSRAIDLVKTYAELTQNTNTALIIGDGGLIIPGYSDDTTLQNQGFNTIEEQEAQREALTANRVLLNTQTDPTLNDWSVTYITAKNAGQRSTIELNNVTYGELGTLSITYEGGS